MVPAAAVRDSVYGIGEDKEREKHRKSSARKAEGPRFIQHGRLFSRIPLSEVKIRSDFYSIFDVDFQSVRCFFLFLLGSSV